MPESVCAVPEGASAVDLRGNNLMGTVPACVWRGEGRPGRILLARNRLSGTVGALGAHHRRVHVNNNALTGELGAAQLGAAQDLEAG